MKEPCQFIEKTPEMYLSVNVNFVHLNDFVENFHVTFTLMAVNEPLININD